MKKSKILLASGSPRRKQLLEALDYEIRQISLGFDETVEDNIKPENVPVNLALRKMKKALAYRENEDAVLTADTVVIHNDEILPKPRDYDQAYEYLTRLSGAVHRVITGVCIHMEKPCLFGVTTNVWVEEILPEDIDYYLRIYQPYDKAGAYGIQEWIGWSHIRRIEGSYSNVMGLPTSEVYRFLENSGKQIR